MPVPDRKTKCFLYISDVNLQPLSYQSKSTTHKSLLETLPNIAGYSIILTEQPCRAILINFLNKRLLLPLPFIRNIYLQWQNA